MSFVTDLLLLSALFALWFVIIFIAKVAFSNPSREVEALKRENEELRKRLREEVESVRQHYEKLLRDVALRNTIALALYNAWLHGKLGKCYREGGEIRVLADGTIICEMVDKSYAIEVPRHG